MIEHVVDQALDLPAEQRPSLIERLCGDDSVLVREVERLLRAIENSDGFLGDPASPSAARLGAWAPGAEPLAPGTTLGAYELTGRLGRGATATVYLARDPKHHRSVAIKVLHPELSAALGAERFLREIEIAATLHHPHILPLFDSGVADGLLYYVMPHVEGESLRHRLADGDQVSIQDAIRIAQEIAGALDHAHQRGVVHRDIKPENILLQDGQAIVADFGIARAINAAGPDRPTRAGRGSGTPAYMSPEQVSDAAAVDGRTDIYALGCVLYEMLAGRPPFTGDSVDQVLAGHVHEPVPSLRLSRQTVSPAVERVIQRALAKAPGDRYPTAVSFAEALAGLSRTLGPQGRRRVATAAGLAFVLVGGALWLSHRRSFPPPSVTTTVAPTNRLAVLPFENLGASADAQFAEGITDAVRDKLATLQGLTVIAPASSDEYGHSAKRPEQIGRELGANYLLTGTVDWTKTPGRPNRVLIRSRLVDAATGAERWAEPFEAEMKDVFQAQSDVAARVAEVLGVSLGASERERLAGTPTRNLAAYSLYLQGRAFWNQRTPSALQNAARYFELAIRQDSAYAEAYAGLATTYELFPEYEVGLASEAIPKAKAAALKALALDSTLGQPHIVLADQQAYQEWSWRDADAEYRRGVALDPSDATAHHWYAVYLSTWVSRLDEALAEIERAGALDPLSRSISSDHGRILYVSRRYGEAIAQLRRTLDLDPDFAPAHDWLGVAYLAKGDTAGVTEVEAAVRLTGRQEYLGDLAYAYAVSGRRARALGALRELAGLSRRQYTSPNEFAVAYTGLGDRDQAFAWLGRAMDAHLSMIATMQVDPMFDPLRSDARFTQLLKRAGLR
jgi:eukaryotic-like serine/threonine-protein kinase